MADMLNALLTVNMLPSGEDMDTESAKSNREQEMKRRIGEDISWESIAMDVFLVQHFAPFANVEGGKVVHSSRPLPYAKLIIQDLRSSEMLEMPILHRIDFRNVWDIFHLGLLAGECLYVSYVPLKTNEYRSFIQNTTIKLFGHIMPQLALLTCPEGIAMFDQHGKVSFEWLEASTTLWCCDDHFDGHSTNLDIFRQSGVFPVSKNTLAVK